MSTLRELADERGITIGAGSVKADAIRNDPGYRKTLRQEFNAITPSPALKMGPLRPSRKVYDFDDADALVNFGVANDMTVRGHTLVWHNQTPDWFIGWEYTDEQIRDVVRDHIHTVAGRYHDKVDTWDVVNEAVADDGTMRDSVWYDAMGEEFLHLAFQWANDVAPNADLYYNDYGADAVNTKSDAIYELVQRLLDRDVPIDGVGLQMHALHSQPDPDSVAENIRRFKDLGLDVQITEMDVAYDPDDKPDDHLAHQAEYYGDVFEASLDAGCDTLITWGVHDGQSWVREYFPELTGDPLLFDDGKDPKQAYHAVHDVFERRD